MQEYEMHAVQGPVAGSISGKGNVESIFGDNTAGRDISGIVLDFWLGNGFGASHDSAFREESVLLNQSAMGILYLAYGPKQFLWKRRDGLVARKIEFLRSTDFLKRMSHEEMVDFAVAEASRLSEKFRIKATINYHYNTEKDLVYVRKYLKV